MSNESSGWKGENDEGSELSDKISVVGGVDAGYESYFTPGVHGKGVTESVVDADGDGAELLELLPRDVNPDDLDDDQKEVIIKAPAFANQGFRVLAEALDHERSQASVSNILHDSAPKLAERVKMDGRGAHGKIDSDAACDTVRRRALDGDSSSDIATDYDASPQAISYHLRGDCSHEPETPELSYTPGQGWSISPPAGADVDSAGVLDWDEELESAIEPVDSDAAQGEGPAAGVDVEAKPASQPDPETAESTRSDDELADGFSAGMEIVFVHGEDECHVLGDDGGPLCADAAPGVGVLDSEGEIRGDLLRTHVDDASGVLSPCPACATRYARESTTERLNAIRDRLGLPERASRRLTDTEVLRLSDAIFSATMPDVTGGDDS